MRIIAGKYRSRIINAPLNDLTRPTADKVRQALFNIIQMYVKNAFVLDLFAGSGALGIEAISEGASFATFIDNNETCIKTINENLNSLKINNAKVIFSDYNILNSLNEKYDIILLDPPYKLDCFNEIFEIILKKNLINEYGIIVYESDINHLLKDEYQGYKLKIKKYGITYLNILFKG